MQQKKYKSSKKRALNLCKQALNHYKCQILNSNDNSGYIEAKKEGNFLSYGNRIIIEISTERNEATIKISSNSVGVQILDWGTNKEIEEDLFQIIDNLI